MAIPWNAIVDSRLGARGSPSSWWELSALSGIPWDRLERLDSDCGEPTLDEALRIARVLRCTVDDIWGSRVGILPFPRRTPRPAAATEVRHDGYLSALIKKIRREIGDLEVLRRLYSAPPPTRKDCRCSNTSASAPASTARPSASPASA